MLSSTTLLAVVNSNQKYRRRACELSKSNIEDPVYDRWEPTMAIDINSSGSHSISGYSTSDSNSIRQRHSSSSTTSVDLRSNIGCMSSFQDEIRDALKPIDFEYIPPKIPEDLETFYSIEEVIMTPPELFDHILICNDIWCLSLSCAIAQAPSWLSVSFPPVCLKIHKNGPCALLRCMLLHLSLRLYQFLQDYEEQGFVLREMEIDLKSKVFNILFHIFNASPSSRNNLRF